MERTGGFKKKESLTPSFRVDGQRYVVIPLDAVKTSIHNCPQRPHEVSAIISSAFLVVDTTIFHIGGYDFPSMASGENLLTCNVVRCRYVLFSWVVPFRRCCFRTWALHHCWHTLKEGRPLREPQEHHCVDTVNGHARIHSSGHVPS